MKGKKGYTEEEDEEEEVVKIRARIPTIAGRVEKLRMDREEKSEKKLSSKRG